MSIQVKVIIILFAVMVGSVAINIMQATRITNLNDIKVEVIDGKDTEIKTITDSLSGMTVLAEFWKTRWDSLKANPDIIVMTLMDTVWLADSTSLEPGTQMAKILIDTLGTDDSLKVDYKIVFEETGDTLRFTTAQTVVVDVWMTEEYKFLMDGTLHQQILDPILTKSPKKVDMKDRLQLLVNSGAFGGVDRFDVIGGLQAIINERWSISAMSNFRKGKNGYHGIYGGYKFFGL